MEGTNEYKVSRAIVTVVRRIYEKCKVGICKTSVYEIDELNQEERKLVDWVLESQHRKTVFDETLKRLLSKGTESYIFEIFACMSESD